MKTNQTFSILIYAKKSKATRNEAPIVARVTIDGKRAEIYLKKKINLDFWNKITGYMKGPGEEVKIVNNYITQVKSKLFRIYTEMQMFDDPISAEGVKLKFTGEKEERMTILKALDYHNEQMAKIVGIDVSPITLKRYKNIRSKVSDFVKKQYKKSDFHLEDLSYQFVTNF